MIDFLCDVCVDVLLYVMQSVDQYWLKIFFGVVLGVGKIFVMFLVVCELKW